MSHFAKKIPSFSIDAPMERVVAEAGIALEDRAAVLDIARALMSETDVEECSFVTLAESPTILMKAYALDTEISARKVFGAIARCHRVKDAVLQFPRVGFGASIGIDIHVLKHDKKGIERYTPVKLETTFFKQRFLSKTKGQDLLTKRLITAADSVVTEMVTYASSSLKIELIPYGPDLCSVRFLGMRECSLSFIERLFERCGRAIEDVTLGSRGIDRFAAIRIRTGSDFPAFPIRENDAREEEGQAKKKPRLFGGGR